MSQTKSLWRRVEVKSPIWTFALLSCGVLFFFCLGSLWEEHLFRSYPGFRFGWYLTFMQLVFMSAFAIAERRYHGEKAWSHEASLYRHGVVAAAMTASRGLTNVSLEYLNYPTQVVFKSLKLLTVMIGSVLFVGRSYKFLEYVSALLTCISAVLFGLGDREAIPQFSWIGIVVVVASLVADSLHSNTQETLLQEYRATLHETMVFSNIFAGIGSLAVCVAIGEFPIAFRYCLESPSIYLIMAAHAIVNYLGVLCFVTSIKKFGAVLATTVTTVRKIVTVMLSFIFFPKPLSERYMYGLAFFFASFCLQYYVQREQVAKGLGIGHNAISNHVQNGASTSPNVTSGPLSNPSTPTSRGTEDKESVPLTVVVKSQTPGTNVRVPNEEFTDYDV